MNRRVPRFTLSLYSCGTVCHLKTAPVGFLCQSWFFFFFFFLHVFFCIFGFIGVQASRSWWGFKFSRRHQISLLRVIYAILDPQEMKEGSEHLDPIIFGQLGLFWSQNSNTKKSTLSNKSYGITYHTALILLCHLFKSILNDVTNCIVDCGSTTKLNI